MLVSVEAEDMGFKKQVIFDHYNEPKGHVKQAPVKRTEVEQAVDVCTYVCVCVRFWICVRVLANGYNSY